MRPPRSPLHLVGREPKTVARKKYERAPLLTPEEARRFRQSVRNLHDAFGTWECLADAMRVTHVAILYMLSGRHAISGDMIIRAMRATGMSYDDLVGPPKLVKRAS